MPPPPNPLCASCRADVQARRSQTLTLADELAKEQAKAKQSTAQSAPAAVSVWEHSL